MNRIELRTLICQALHKHFGTQYGQIKTMESLPPVPGEPVQLRVTAPDPLGEDRVFLVEITEEG